MINIYNQLALVKVKVTQSCPTLCDHMDYRVHGILQARILEWWPFPSPGDLPNPGSNPSLPHCSQILYPLSHKESPRILEWIAYPFSSRSSRPKHQTGVSCITCGFFISLATREVWACILSHFNCVQLCTTPWTVARQGPLLMGFSRQEHWSGWPCPPSEDLSDPGIEAISSVWQADALPLRHLGNPDVEIQGSIYRFLMFKG